MIEYIQLFLEDSLNFHINEMKKLHIITRIESF